MTSHHSALRPEATSRRAARASEAQITSVWSTRGVRGLELNRLVLSGAGRNLDREGEGDEGELHVGFLRLRRPASASADSPRGTLRNAPRRDAPISLSEGLGAWVARRYLGSRRLWGVSVGLSDTCIFHGCFDIKATHGGEARVRSSKRFRERNAEDTGNFIDRRRLYTREFTKI